MPHSQASSIQSYEGDFLPREVYTEMDRKLQEAERHMSPESIMRGAPSTYPQNTGYFSQGPPSQYSAPLPQFTSQPQQSSVPLGTFPAPSPQGPGSQASFVGSPHQGEPMRSYTFPNIPEGSHQKPHERAESRQPRSRGRASSVDPFAGMPPHNQSFGPGVSFQDPRISTQGFDSRYTQPFQDTAHRAASAAPAPTYAQSTQAPAPRSFSCAPVTAGTSQYQYHSINQAPPEFVLPSHLSGAVPTAIPTVISARYPQPTAWNANGPPAGRPPSVAPSGPQARAPFRNGVAQSDIPFEGSNQERALVLRNQSGARSRAGSRAPSVVESTPGTNPERSLIVYEAIPEENDDSGTDSDCDSDTGTIRTRTGELNLHRPSPRITGRNQVMLRGEKSGTGAWVRPKEGAEAWLRKH